MPDDELTAEEIWLRKNAPEVIEKMTADQIASLKEQGKTEELVDFLEKRERIDKAWQERGDKTAAPKIWQNDDETPEENLKTTKAKSARFLATHRPNVEAFNAEEKKQIAQQEGQDMSEDGKDLVIASLKADERVLKDMLAKKDETIKDLRGRVQALTKPQLS